MKEMVYTDHPDRIVLDSGTKDGYDWVILSLGFHPCAYAKIPKNHPKYSRFRANGYDDFYDIVCHGGITFAATTLDLGKGNRVKGRWIGFDYDHFGDYSGNKVFDELLNSGAKKWTTSEIRREVFNVINQLKKMEVLS